MRFQISVLLSAIVTSIVSVSSVHAATIPVSTGSELQAAIDAAQAGDVIALDPNGTYVGNFVLQNKGVLGDFITIRSAAPDSSLPAAGVRMTPSYAALLPKIRSGNNMSAMRTATGANHWKLMFLEFQANLGGFGEIVALGAGDSTQTMESQAPYALVVDRIYMHGDPVFGQKRCLSVNSKETDVLNSYIAECKAIGQDSQAIGGWNSPGKLRIENNYLEGSTENMLIGGGDPPTPDLVTTGVTVRYNHMAKPLAWMKPIMPTPTGVVAQAVPGGGSLPAGTYAYRVAARRKSNQNAMATSASSVEASVTIAAGTTGGVTISWTPISGAEVYLVYGRTPGGQTMYWKTTDPFITDTGAEGTAVNTGTERPTYAGTKWDVKNIFELKNAQDVTVEFNVFENLWVAGQSGYPIVFTPRNQYKSAPWTIVQRVTFQHNIVRHTAGGVNILGLDNNGVSRLTNNIVVKDNLFEDLSSAPFGAAKPFMVGDGPEAVTIDHNTVITNQATIVSFYGAPAMGFAYTNNMSIHGTYGMNGSGSTPGLPTLTTFTPDGNVCNNVLAGGSAKIYPACNYFPAVDEWIAGFADYKGGDYHLVGAAVDAYRSTDGPMLGADIDIIDAVRRVVLRGSPDATSGPPVKILTTALPPREGLTSVRMNIYYQTTLACTGGRSTCAWRLAESSSLPAGLEFDTDGTRTGVPGTLFGTPTVYGPVSITVEAYDPEEPKNFDRKTFALDIALPELKLVYRSVPGVVGVPYRVAPTVTYAVGALTFKGVGLPPGLTLNPSTGVIEGIPTKVGEFPQSISVTDSTGNSGYGPPLHTIWIAAAPVVIAPIQLADGTLGTMYSAQLQATGGGTFGAAVYTWFLDGGALPPGLTMTSSGTITGVPAATGTFSFHVTVFAGTGLSSAADGRLTILPKATAPSDIVLYAKDATAIKGTWSVVDDATAAGGKRIANPDAAAAKLAAPLAAPANYFELTFNAQANVPYHLWMRGKAAGNAWANDSVYVQFSGSTDANGTAINRIGTAQAATVSIEEKSGAGLSEWGWADDSYSGLAGPIYLSGGLQTIRVQVREDGLSLDQIVLGADKYTSMAPGATKNDATVVPRTVAPSRTVVLYAADAAAKGAWTVVADATAAGGRRLSNPDAAAPKLTAALASPANYFEMTFNAEAGVAYHLWMRGKAAGNAWANDSVYVQFSGSRDANGTAVNRIGTTAAMAVSIEEASGAGLSEWGWADDSYGGFGAPIYFDAAGPQTIRVQVREDGASFDQVVLSADRFATTAPGAAKNDTTILPR